MNGATEVSAHKFFIKEVFGFWIMQQFTLVVIVLIRGMVMGPVWCLSLVYITAVTRIQPIELLCGK